MIFVRKLVLACLINSIKYISISYSAHIWIKKCLRESFISDTCRFLRWNSSHRPSFIHHQQSFRTIIYITSIHVSKFNLSCSLLITVCTTKFNVLFFANVIAGWMLNSHRGKVHILADHCMFISPETGDYLGILSYLFVIAGCWTDTGVRFTF
jgi:hypothetical protein